jgi:hypothetical protein
VQKVSFALSFASSHGLLIQLLLFGGLLGGLAALFLLHEGSDVAKFVGVGTVVVVWASCYKAHGKCMEDYGNMAGDRELTDMGRSAQKEADRIYRMRSPEAAMKNGIQHVRGKPMDTAPSITGAPKELASEFHPKAVIQSSITEAAISSLADAV